LRSNKYQPPAAGLLENYESNSLVEVDDDTDLKVSHDTGTRPKAMAAKTAKLEVEKKKKRKRKTSPPPAVETLVIPTPPSREVESDEEEEDKATDDPPVIEERTVRRSLSPATKMQQEFG
jgi:hypothetical protein